MSVEREINLLPLRFRQRIAIRQILVGWSWAAAAVAGCCAFQVTVNYTRQQRHEEQIAALEQTNKPVLALLDERQQLQDQQRELLSIRARVEALRPSDDLLQTLGAIATAAVPTSSAGAPEQAAGGTRIQSLRIDLSGATTPQSAAAGDSLATHVSFTAVTRDEPNLTHLITRLRSNPRLRNVRLRGTAEHDSGGGRRAEVEAEVVVEKELPQ